MHLEQVSNFFFCTVAARTTWQCKSCAHSRSGPDNCKCLFSILVEIRCTYPAVGIAGGSSYNCALLLSLSYPSLGDTRAALQFSHSERHGAIFFFFTKDGMDGVSNFFSVNRPVYSVGIKQVPQV